MLKNLLALALLITTSDAFVPAATRNAVVQSAESSTTSLGPGFLKDLGFEKPSWLPDFGGGDKKKEEVVAEAAETEEGDEAEEGADSEEVPAK